MEAELEAMRLLIWRAAWMGTTAGPPVGCLLWQGIVDGLRLGVE